MATGRHALLAAVATVVIGCSESHALTDAGPGRTGDAGIDAGTAVALDGGVDAERFCVDRGTWRCARLRAAADLCPGAMRFSMAEYDACVAALPTTCAGSRFDVACTPSQSVLDACIGALAGTDNICVPEPMLSECELCTRP